MNDTDKLTRLLELNGMMDEPNAQSIQGERLQIQKELAQSYLPLVERLISAGLLYIGIDTKISNSTDFLDPEWNQVECFVDHATDRLNEHRSGIIIWAGDSYERL